jgi:MFS family permease
MAVVANTAQYQRNITIYTLLEMANGAAFVSSNWLFFWLRLMQYGQVGVMDALGFAFGMFMEIPTGAIADMLGKKWTMVSAMACLAVGWAVMGASDSLLALLIGFWIANVGWAFYSGASEALCYDSLKMQKREGEFDKVLSRIGVYAIATLLICTLAGGWLYNIDVRLPHYAWAVVMGLGFVVSLWIIEPPIEREKFSWRGYVRQLGVGFHELGMPNLRPYILPSMLMRGVGFMFRSGLILPIMAIGYGFNVDAQAVTNTLIYFVGLVAIASVPRMRRILSDGTSLIVLSVLMGVGYGMALLPIGVFGFLGMAAIRWAHDAVIPLSSVIINREIPSESRATTLSTITFITKIPYVLTAIIAGSMAENGLFGVFCLIVGAVTIGVTVLNALAFRRYKLKIAVP